MSDKEIVIVSGVRTPIGSFGGSLRDVTAVELGSLVIREAMIRAGLRPKPSQDCLDCGPDALKNEQSELDKKYNVWDESLTPVHVDEVIMGNVLQGGQGQNPGRRATIFSGMPEETPGYAINKLCGSGLKSVILGAQAIMSGDAEIVIAGGMESMSCAPYILPKARWGYRMNTNVKAEMYDLLVWDGLWESFYGYHMGNTAENIAAKYGISRQEQDEVGAISHQRAMSAIKKGFFKDEIIPVTIPQKKGDPKIFDTDERPMDTSVERMAKLPPAFKEGGTVTAGNASGINDAAAAVVLMSREKANELGLKPFAAIKAYASAGIDPAYMGLGPIAAVRKAMRSCNLRLQDMNLLEVNEAFAAQAIGCFRELDINIDNVNLHGSGISLGHPVGATGARILVTAIHEMKRIEAHYGLVTMCIGGGQGIAMILER